jgi:hypothetical protein
VGRQREINRSRQSNMDRTQKAMNRDRQMQELGQKDGHNPGQTDTYRTRQKDMDRSRQRGMNTNSGRY